MSSIGEFVFQLLEAQTSAESGLPATETCSTQITYDTDIIQVALESSKFDLRYCTESRIIELVIDLI